MWFSHYFRSLDLFLEHDALDCEQSAMHYTNALHQEVVEHISSTQVIESKAVFSSVQKREYQNGIYSYWTYISTNVDDSVESNCPAKISNETLSVGLKFSIPQK
ncbi:hypothetical protein EG68_03891 [Paragonimus skrjabini miyazakii]|uniref:Uncharacterized protein n=1 Tax=Paragonimus skrjabini miyazakii TaxID=59628 RepID=A0A8S9YUC0_9TREM|nr:hypothetical protein EG68_03891 [Paragonimus skrjabini miyazakii]